MVGRDENGAPRRRSKRALEELSGRIRALESGSRGAGDGSASARPEVPSGLAALRGLERGVLHEFCGVGDEGGRSGGGPGPGRSVRDPRSVQGSRSMQGPRSVQGSRSMQGPFGRICGGWAPPIALLVHLARAGLERARLDGVGRAASVVWIGRRLWPYPGALLGDTELVDVGSGDLGLGDVGFGDVGFGGGSGRAGAGGAGTGDARTSHTVRLVERTAIGFGGGTVDGCSGGTNGGAPDDGAPDDHRDARREVRREVRGDVLARSLFVDPGPRALVWAADRALRCAGSAVVVIDGRGLDLGTTRRLQLAAEASGALALVARPAGDAQRPSVASSRWLVERATTAHDAGAAGEREIGDRAIGGGANDSSPSFRLTPLKRRATRWRHAGHTVPLTGRTASDPSSSPDREKVPHDHRSQRVDPSSSCGTSSRSGDEDGSDAVRSAG